MSFRRLIAYNTLIQIIGKVLGVGFSLGTVILLTRYLGVAGYGRYNTVMVFVGFFVILADLGIYKIAVREMAQNKKRQAQILGNAFIYRIFSSLLIFVFAFLVGLLMPYEPIVKLAIGIVAIQSAASSLNILLRSVFQVNYRMDLPTFLEIISRGLYFALTLLAIHLKYDLLVIFWLFVISTFFNLLLIYLLALKFTKIKLQFDKKFLRYFLKESWPLGLVAALIMINVTIGPILLSFYKSMTAMGIYGIAYRVFENLIIIPFIFVDLILPRLSELYKTDRSKLKIFFQKAFDILLIVVFPVTILFFFMAPHWIYIIGGGKEFIAAYHPLRTLIFAVAAIFLSAPFANFLIACGKQKWLILSTSLVVFLNITLNLILIPRYSYNGVALATLIAEAVYLVVLFFLTNHLLGVKPLLSLAKKLILPAFLIIVFLNFILSISFFSLGNFAQFNLVKQIVLVIAAFLSTGGLYILILLGLNIIPLNFVRALIYREKVNGQS